MTIPTVTPNSAVEAKIRSLAEKAETVFVFANNHWQGRP